MGKTEEEKEQDRGIRIESIKSMDRMLRLARRLVTAKSLKGLRLG
jgi:hypothetical protein